MRPRTILVKPSISFLTLNGFSMQGRDHIPPETAAYERLSVKLSPLLTPIASLIRHGYKTLSRLSMQKKARSLEEMSKCWIQQIVILIFTRYWKYSFQGYQIAGT